MTIWILAIVLLGSLAAMGYRQGAIRAAASFVGILIGAFLAVPIGHHLLRPLAALVGLKNPLLLWLATPVAAFVIVVILFKIVGLLAHKKAEVHYKYKADDQQRAYWERLNHRLGLSVGVANGAAYLVLLSFAIYTVGYWTYQMSAGDADPQGIRWINRLGRDSVRTGMARVARAVDRLPSVYYDAADIAGLIYHNPLLEARIARYPAFLGLGERSEFQDLANDMQFTEAWQRQASLKELINNPKVQVILKNPDLLNTIWATFATDLPDFQAFLETGKSAKYDSEKILGRWSFNVNAAVILAGKNRPNQSSADMLKLRRWMALNFAKVSFVAAPAPDQSAILKNIPRVKPGTPPTLEYQNFQGQWKNAGGNYRVTLNMDGKTQELTASVEDDRLTLSGAGLDLAFDHED